MAKATVGCKCLEQVAPQLAKHNCQIDAPLQINFKKGTGHASQPLLKVVKIDPKSRAKLMNVLCTYCPFCGKKYPESE